MTNTDEKNDNTPTNAAILIILVLVTTPLFALLDAWACSTLWRWFIARDLGAGPSSAAWFGIGTVISLLITLPARQGKKTASTKKTVEVSLTHPVLTLASVGLAYFVGVIVGWL